MPAKKTKKAATKAPARPRKAPLTWRFKTKRGAFGMFVDDNLAWIGNENGEVFALNHKGEGAKYVADEVRVATQGGFYRVLGEIKQLAS